MATSCLWFLIALMLNGYILFSVAHGAKQLHDWKISELIVGAVIFVQPLLTIWAILRANRLRNQGSGLRNLGRAALPLSTVTLLAGSIVTNIYYKRYIEENLVQQRSTGTISWDCSAKSQTVDFNSDKTGPIGLRLISTRRRAQSQNWIVQWPGKAPISATKFDASTGSIGGSMGLTWLEISGKPMAPYCPLVTSSGRTGLRG